MSEDEQSKEQSEKVWDENEIARSPVTVSGAGQL